MVFDKQWFQDHQNKLLFFANTFIGRYILRIHGKRSSVGKNKIIRIFPHAIEWENENGSRSVEIRTHNKFSKRLYFAFKPLWQLVHWWDTLFANNVNPALNMGFDTLNLYPDEHPEITTVDGQVSHRNFSGLTFSAIRDATGTNASSGGGLGTICSLRGDSNTNEYDVLLRSIFLFDPTVLVPEDIISSVTFRVFGDFKADGLGTDSIHLAGSFPASNTNLVAGDYDAVARTSFGSIAYASFNTGGYNDFSLNAETFDIHNIQRYSLQLGWDINNSFTGTWSAGAVTGFDGYFADAGGTSPDPTLQIDYTPFVQSAPEVRSVRLWATGKTRAIVAGEVTDNGNARITEQGFVVSTSPHPTLSDTVVYADNFNSYFVSKIEGLAESTTYYARAYATNSQGTTYATTDIVFTTTTEISEKEYLYRVYSNNQHIATWSEDVISLPAFTQQVNRGRGTLDIKLARNFDSVSDEIALNNRVECYVVDKERPSGKLLYTGYIASHRPELRAGDREQVSITLFPYDVELNRIILRDEDGNTTLTYTSQDPALILKDVLAKYARSGGKVVYRDQDIWDTNTQITISFKGATVQEAIDEIVKLSPSGFYWRIDEGASLHFKKKETYAEHLFAIGLDVQKLETFRRVEDLVNSVYFTGAGDPPLYRLYESSDSRDNFGRYDIRIIDSRVEEVNTAQAISQAQIGNFNTPEIRSVFEILDSNKNRFGYDIEEVQVGQMIQIKNQKGAQVSPTYWDIAIWDEDVWDQTITSAAGDILQVHTIQYTDEKITLLASSRVPQLSERVEEVERRLKKKQTSNLPIIPN